jgi:hypothetical protein
VLDNETTLVDENIPSPRRRRSACKRERAGRHAWMFVAQLISRCAFLFEYVSLLSKAGGL